MTQTMIFNGPGFSMQVPTDWSISSNSKYQAIFSATTSTGEFRPNLVVAVRRVKAEVKATDVAATARVNQEAEYNNYNLRFENELTNGSFKRSYMWDHKESKSHIHQTQFFQINKSLLYTLTATNTSDQSDFEELLNQMIESFCLNA